MDDNTKDGVKTPEEDMKNKEQSTATATTEEVVAEAATTGTAAAVQKPSEFSQIVWPKAGRLWSETLTVIIVAAIIAVIIFFVDLGLRTGIEFLIQ